MKIIKSIRQFCLSRYFALTLFLWGHSQSVFAAPDTSKIGKFEIPGVSSNSDDLIGMVWAVVVAIFGIAFLVLLGWGHYIVMEACFSVYRAAVDPNDRVGMSDLGKAIGGGIVVFLIDYWFVNRALTFLTN